MGHPNILRLEPRILFDGMGSVDSEPDCPVDTFDADASAESDPATEAEADEMADPDDPLVSGDESEMVWVDPAGDDAPPPPADGLLFVHDTTTFPASFLPESIREDAQFLSYDASTTTLEQLYALIEGHLAGAQVDSIAFAGIGFGDGAFSLTNDALIDADFLLMEGEAQAFWGGIGGFLHEGGRVDLFAEGFGDGDEGAFTLRLLESLAERNVVASDDPTALLTCHAGTTTPQDDAGGLTDAEPGGGSEELASSGMSDDNTDADADADAEVQVYSEPGMEDATSTADAESSTGADDGVSDMKDAPALTSADADTVPDTQGDGEEGAGWLEDADAEEDLAWTGGDGAQTDAPIRVLVVDTSVHDAQTLLDAAQEGVLTVAYDSTATNLEELRTLILNALDGAEAESIAFANHSRRIGEFVLARDVVMHADTFAASEAQQLFWQDIAERLTENGRIDLLACHLTAFAKGEELVAMLESLTGRAVAASDNSTGNDGVRGDWILERGGVDVEAVYFCAERLPEFSGRLAELLVTTVLDTGDDFTISGSLVDDMNDGDGLSLREALYWAVEGDVIRFHAGTDGTAILLTDTLTLGSYTITIQGNGQGQTIIDGGGTNAFRIFTFSSDVTLQGLTLVNGGASSVDGGAVWTSGALTVDDCGFSGNTGEKGGAIYSESGAVTVTGGSVFQSNTAVYGGGAIFSSNGMVTIQDSTFSANEATSGNGGAIFSYDGAVEVDNSTFSENVATLGGAIYASQNTVTISGGSQFSHNDASMSGGAIYASVGNVSITDGSTFTSNRALGHDGGAVFVSSGSVTASGGSAFENNTAALSGGAIYSASSTGTVTVNASDFTGNIANTASVTGGGGAIYVEHASVSVLNSSTFHANVSYGSGGAIFVMHGGVTVDASTFSNNIVNNDLGEGGAIRAHNGDLTISGASLFQLNQAGKGGGVAVNFGGLVIQGQSEFNSNFALFSGGAVFSPSSTSIVIDSARFINNEADGTEINQGGGAIHAQQAHVVVKAGSLFRGNRSSRDGGAIQTHSGALTVEGGVEFSENSAGVNGGAIDARNGLSVSNSTFAYNTANLNGGAIHYGGTAGTVEFLNVTLSGNVADADQTATGSGGAIFNLGSSPFKLVNTIVAGNAIGALPDANGADVSGMFDAASNHNLIGIIDGSSGLAGTGTLYGTLGSLLDAGLGTFDLHGGATKSFSIDNSSQAYNAGNNAAASGLTYDQRGTGFDRIVGGTVDIGAFEYQGTGTNSAPELNAAFDPALDPVQEGETDPVGNTVGEIVVDGSITDTDVSPAPESIAIIGVDSTNGNWQYSLDAGATWIDVSVVSDANALLLEAHHRVRFIPSAGFIGSATFTFRAWDMTMGTAGGYADASVNGSTTAFSAESDTASITVEPVSDPVDEGDDEGGESGHTGGSWDQDDNDPASGQDDGDPFSGDPDDDPLDGDDNDQDPDPFDGNDTDPDDPFQDDDEVFDPEDDDVVDQEDQPDESDEQGELDPTEGDDDGLEDSAEGDGDDGDALDGDPGEGTDGEGGIDDIVGAGDDDPTPPSGDDGADDALDESLTEEPDGELDDPEDMEPGGDGDDGESDEPTGAKPTEPGGEDASESGQGTLSFDDEPLLAWVDPDAPARPGSPGETIRSAHESLLQALGQLRGQDAGTLRLVGQVIRESGALLLQSQRTMRGLEQALARLPEGSPVHAELAGLLRGMQQGQAESDLVVQRIHTLVESILAGNRSGDRFGLELILSNMEALKNAQRAQIELHVRARLLLEALDGAESTADALDAQVQREMARTPGAFDGFLRDAFVGSIVEEVPGAGSGSGGIGLQPSGAAQALLAGAGIGAGILARQDRAFMAAADALAGNGGQVGIPSFQGRGISTPEPGTGRRLRAARAACDILAPYL